MCCIIERSVDSEVGVEVAHVVGNYVNHDQDVALVAGVDEILEIFLWSEVIVELIEISAPIAMVAAVPIVDNGGDPDGIEAHTLYVVQIVSDSSISSTAVVPYLVSHLPKFPH